MRGIAVLAVVLVAGATACSRNPSSTEQRLPPLPARPLAGIAGQQVIVLPVRYLRPGDSLGWADRVAAPRELMRSVDDDIARVLIERGQTGWVYAARVVSSAKRNAAFAPDPYALAAEALRPGVRRAPQLAEPLASQIRSLVALHEGRYALYPVELRFERPTGAAGSTGRAVLHVALVDARLAQVILARDVAGDTASSPPEATASLAGRFADLILPP